MSTTTLSAMRDVARLVWTQTDAFGLRRWALALALLALSSSLAASAPVALKFAVDALVSNHVPTAAVAPALLIGAYVLAQWLARCAGALRWATYGPAIQRLQRRVSGRIFEHVMALPMRFHVERKTGALSQTLAQGLTGLEIMLEQALFSILPVVAEFSIITVILIQLGQPVLLGVLGAASLLYAAAFALCVARIGRQSSAISTATIDSSAVLTDTLLNYETVKYFSAEEEVRDRYDESLAAIESHWRRLYRTMVSNGAVIASVFAVSLGACIGYAALQVAAGTMTIGDFVLVNAYVLQLTRPLEALGVAVQNVTRGLGFVAKMLELLACQPESAMRTPAAARARGALQFERVSLRYRPGRPILEGVSLEIAPGTTLAVVGASGAGKSSLVRLLLRLYEPDDGRILLDGVPIAEMSLANLRSSIAVVPQDAILFNDSIGRNIAFGRRDATRADIERSARIAHLHEFVMTLPEGYDTIVGERGVKLSGGEKQRVAIARAALKAPSIYVFDEATASLDTPTERAILQNLFEVSRGCTTLAIAHRLSTIVHSDEIVVLEHGRVIERGTHASLLRLGGRYATTWLAQQDADSKHAARVSAA